MAKNKTAETEKSVAEFLDSVSSDKKRADSFALIDLFKSITGYEPKMWGPSIIGFGSYHYRYDSGHEGDAPMAGFSPRKDAITLYVATEFEDRELLLSQLGKHKSSKSCVYVKKLEDIDLSILSQMIINSMPTASHVDAKSGRCGS